MLSTPTPKKRVRKENKELGGHRSELHTRVQSVPATPALKRLKACLVEGERERERKRRERERA